MRESPKFAPAGGDGSAAPKIVRASGLLTVALAVIALVGWTTSARALASWWPGLMPMAPSTAIGLLLLGVAALARHRGVQAALGLIVAGVAGLQLAQLGAGSLPTIDVWLVPAPDLIGRAPAGWMSPLTAALFSLSGAAVVLLAGRLAQSRRGDVGGLLGAVVGAASVVLVLGYVYGTPLLYGGRVVPVALTTALAFATLSAGMVAMAGRSHLPLRAFCGESSRARLFRAFFPIAPAVVAADGLLFRLVPTFNPALHSAFLALVLGLVVTAGIARAAHVVGRALDRAEAEARDRARAERDVIERSRLLAESQRVARIGSYRLDIAAGVWTGSEMLDEIFGIDDPAFEKNLSGWLAIVHPDERREMAEYFETEVLGRGRPFDREYRIRRLGDGQERWVHGLGELLPDEEGRSVEMIGTIQDVTEAKASESLLRKSQKLEAVGQLAGGVAHDFNNLLGVITGYAELALKDLALDHVAGARLRRVLDAAERGARLSRQLLAFSRRQVMRPEVLDLNAALADLVEMLKRVVGEAIELEMRTEPGLGAVRADPTQIERVVMNLVVNARDAMPRGGRLTIETANADLDEAYAATHPPVRPGRYVMAAVSDTGTGMDSETQKRIFEPFFTTKASGEGTGLGLATVYGIVKQSGGYIWVYSELGLGTTVKVYVPRVDEVPQPAAGPAGDDSPLGGCETLLVVEDAEDLRDLVRETLEDGGYRVLSAADGEAAIGAAEDHPGPIDLLLADIVMPRMSGPELGHRLGALRPGMRQLYMSGYASGAVSRQQLLDPAVDLLEKPFSSKTLLRAVRTALDRSPTRST